MLGAGRHLLALINDILDLSKIEAGRIEIHLDTFGLAPLINDVVKTIEPLAAKNENRVAVSCDAAIGTLHADQMRLRQALLNLMSNANKFTERGRSRHHRAAGAPLLAGVPGDGERPQSFHRRATSCRRARSRGCPLAARRQRRKRHRRDGALQAMIVDDVLLHVGSANLNNRSIGLDTECDIAIEARTQAERSAIERLRNRLLGHHCGVAADAVASSLTQTGSLVRTALTLRAAGHYLAPVNEAAVPAPPLSAMESLADPGRPDPATALPGDDRRRAPESAAAASAARGHRRRRRDRRADARVALHAARIAGTSGHHAAVACRDSAGPGSAVARDRHVRRRRAHGVSLVVLIAATAAAFGPWLGPFVYAFAGALASAIVTYAVGAAIGREALESVLGARLERVRRAVVERGVFAVAAIRLVPIAPFTLVNMAAGASKVRFADYLIGTAIGMAPGITTMSALGYQILSTS